MERLIETFSENVPFFTILIRDHILISFAAIIIAAVLGIALGIYISGHKKIAAVIMGGVNILYTVPAIALLGFLIAFTGVGNTTAVIALIIYALLPIVRSTYTGMNSIDPLIIEAAVGMGSTPSQVLWKVKLPLALPIIMSGLRSMTTMTIALAGIASFIGAGGLGVAIYRGITTNNPSMTMAGSILIALLALITDWFLGKVETKVDRHTKINRGTAKKILAALVIILVGFGVFHSFSNKKYVHIATKPVTEGYILGDMIKDIIEDRTDIKVKITQGVGGGTSNIHPGMLKGDFDIYPEYTGTVWQIVLKDNSPYDESKFPILEKEYKDKYGLVWANLFGFNDTYGIAVRNEIVKKYNLKRISDLKGISENLIFGAEYDFYEREDGFKALTDKYGLHFKKELDMDNGLKYQAIKDGKIDAMTVFTTDGQLATSDITVLQDDKHLYPSYLAGTVVREATLKKYPELKEVLALLNNILDDKEMARLNSLVESGHKNPEDVAREYLVEKHLIGGKK
ncbi:MULTISPECIES: glycine betaine ABC transporter substrate-binding protein [unclassified Fusobacterium]|uniref:ABC transporter permease/substrate-binding protein n=1 Tax=unclassified Fusobacterium TaxID=2648384 RepID=UPI001B8DA32E|nr:MULTISPECIES: glycine betaine ABC transporter substrate-binding protein [unclassified Fusobacterium]MBR8700742.1 hypothetical protein [Fusobacterium sp. DD45]MBR8710521.1 hypothetical protein [Fusobacterium sp. DD28]MBR8751129.1 hypothetical protein [Fusobacterium sp. DD26]